MENITAACRYLPGKSTIPMLPLIELNAADESCIYATLLHIKDLVERMSVPTPSITSEQPLWWKTVEIVSPKKLNIVVCLGSFHYLISYIGSVGTSVEGFGSEKLLQHVY